MFYFFFFKSNNGPYQCLIANLRKMKFLQHYLQSDTWFENSSTYRNLTIRSAHFVKGADLQSGQDSHTCLASKHLSLPSSDVRYVRRQSARVHTKYTSSKWYRTPRCSTSMKATFANFTKNLITFQSGVRVN